MATLREVLVQSLLIVLLLGSFVGVATGVALVVQAQAALDFLRRMNRWVTNRIDQKAREEHPVGATRALSAPQRRVAGTAFTLGGAYAAILLASAPKIPAATLLQARGVLWAVYLFLADVLRWVLVVGCTAAVVIGVLLLFFPAAWTRIEARANGWYSTREVFARADVMHTPLDQWIERSPRLAGALVAALSLIAVAAFAIPSPATVFRERLGGPLRSGGS